jgi:hypothetical protein
MKERTLKLSLDSILALDSRTERKSFFDEVSSSSATAGAYNDNSDFNLTRINQVIPRPSADNFLEPWTDVSKEKKAKMISEYFKKNPFAHLKNFPKAKKIFLDFFDNVENIAQDVEFLREELDKSTASSDQYGKVIINFFRDKDNSAKFKLQFFRPMMEEIKQFFVFDLSKPKDGHESFQTVTQNEKSKKLIINRSLKNTNSAIRNSLKSTAFDAEIWKGFIQDKIQPDQYDRVMDCLERNHINFEDFVKLVNSRDNKYLKFLHKDFLKNISIRTNSKDTSFINFKTESNQQIELKLNKYALSLQLS